MDVKRINDLYLAVGILIVCIVLYYIISMVNTDTANETFAAPAAIIHKESQNMVPRKIAPSGPNPPNSIIPEIVARQNDNYNVIPNDPQDEKYSSQDIQDNLRYPERSFKPGKVNSESKLFIESGVASNKMLESSQPLQPFSNEMVQNGGLFGSVGPDDTHTNPNYASF
jgi:hypothetical protein